MDAQKESFYKYVIRYIKPLKLNLNKIPVNELKNHILNEYLETYKNDYSMPFADSLINNAVKKYVAEIAEKHYNRYVKKNGLEPWIK